MPLHPVEELVISQVGAPPPLKLNSVGATGHRSFDFISYIKTLNNYLCMHREQALLCSLEDIDEVVATIR